MSAATCSLSMAAMARSIFSIFIIFYLFSINLGQCERVKDKMYLPLDGAFCFRILSASGQFGCTTSFSGETGVLHFVDSSPDVDWIVNNGDAAPYAAVVELKSFIKSDMLKLKNSGKVSGMVLWNNSSLPGFSNEDTCPNRHSGLPSEACDVTDAWNPVGSGMLYVDWGFPIVFVQNLTTIELMRECFEKHNMDPVDQKERALCAIQVQSHMLAAVDSQTCMRRSLSLKTFTPVKYCDALGDYSVYVSSATQHSYGPKSVILLMARMDGSSMFDGITPGAMSPVTNIATMLTASAYLKDMGTFPTPSNMTLVVVLLNGESFDYIGSSRVVYDMQKGQFPNADQPIHLDDVGLIVELDQISGSHYFFHTHSNDTIVNTFIENLNKTLSPLNIHLDRSQGKLPPASLQRFLMAEPSIPALVLTNYNSSYVNRYYNSILDTADALEYVYANGTAPTSKIQQEIDSVAFGVANSLYRLLHVNGPVMPSPVHSKLVDELLHCFLETMNCSLFYDVTNGTSLLESPAPTYVGVYQNNNTITRLTGLTLASLTGNVMPDNMTECSSLSSPGVEYIWMTNRCIESSVNYYVAWSPAFEMEDYNWTSNAYSSWTESVWRELSMRMFLKPSLKQEVLNIAVGLVILLISFAAVYFVNLKSDLLFNRVVLRTSEGAW